MGLESMTRILALDLGTTTGWALWQDKHIVSGHVSFKPGRYEGGGMRYLRFQNWLHEIKGKKHIDYLFFEEVRAHTGTDASHVYGGFLGSLTAWCEAQKVPYMGIPVGEIKSYATGKGNAGKPAMVSAVQAMGYPHVVDDNEADALALLHLKLAERPTF